MSPSLYNLLRKIYPPWFFETPKDFRENVERIVVSYLKGEIGLKMTLGAIRSLNLFKSKDDVIEVIEQIEAKPNYPQGIDPQKKKEMLAKLKEKL